MTRDQTINALLLSFPPPPAAGFPAGLGPLVKGSR